MAKKTEKTDPKKAPAKAAAKPAKAAKAPKADKKATVARGPRASVVSKHTSKAALAKSLAEAVARADEDTDLITERLSKASNQQLLRLHAVAEVVKKKYGNRGKMIAAIGAAKAKSKDKDFLAKLDTMSLPTLLDMAKAADRAAKPA